jgi:hypothetical protein
MTTLISCANSFGVEHEVAHAVGLELHHLGSFCFGTCWK